MDIAFAETIPKPLNPTAPVFTAASSSKNDNTVDPVNSATALQDPANNGPQKLDNPSTIPIQANTAINGNNTAGNPATPSTNDQQNKSQHDSSNKNSGDDHLTPMNTQENPVTSDDVTKFQASSPFNDLVKDKESKNQTLNRIKFYLNSKYPTSFKSARYYGVGDEAIIIASFKDEDDFKQLLSDEHHGLKQNDDSDTLPQFHPYDAVKVRTEESLRSIVATDIRSSSNIMRLNPDSLNMAQSKNLP